MTAITRQKMFKFEGDYIAKIFVNFYRVKNASVRDQILANLVNLLTDEKRVWIDNTAESFKVSNDIVCQNIRLENNIIYCDIKGVIS